MKRDMFEININSIFSQVVTKVFLSITIDDAPPLFIGSYHVHGEDVVNIEMGDPFSIHLENKTFRTSFTEEELTNYVLDWMLTEEGTKEIKRASNLAKKNM